MDGRTIYEGEVCAEEQEETKELAHGIATYSFEYEPFPGDIIQSPEKVIHPF